MEAGMRKYDEQKSILLRYLIVSSGVQYCAVLETPNHNLNNLAVKCSYLYNAEKRENCMS